MADDKIEYPKFLYSATSEQPALVLTADEHDALGDGWFESPGEAVAKDPGTQVIPVEPAPEVKLAGLNKAKLIAHAKEQHLLELDPALTNAELIAKIEEARAAAAKDAK